MDRDTTVKYMSTAVTPQEQVAVIRNYIYDRKEINWQPQQLDVDEVSTAFSYIIQYYAAKHGVHVVRSQENNILKIW